MRPAPNRDRACRRPLRVAVLTGLAAASLGPLAAIAAAGGPPVPAAPGPAGSGGGGISTTQSGTGTTGTGSGTGESTSTTATATVASTTVAVTSTTSATSTSVAVCTGPSEGTVTSTMTVTTPATPATTSTVSATMSDACPPAPPPPMVASPGPRSAPPAQRGMWIWELPATDGGNLAAIITQARRYGIATVYVKSGDGNGVWSQFTPGLVRSFHAAGIRVCAWQYVYGKDPLAEATVGVDSVRDGADCLVIDAEAEYAGRYVSAQTYLGALRARVGSRYPIALAGLPYVDFHPTFPYSVFLGPNGAQYDLPQMYWQDIGTTVPAVYAHTYAFNELYQRPIDPLGQLYGAPPAASVRAFRSLGIAYRATGLSWWDWQSAGTAQFGAIAARVSAPPAAAARTTVASLGRGAGGDLVLLAQEHLWNTRERVSIDGSYGLRTQRAVAAFQTEHGLMATGVLSPATWNRLLAVPAPRLHWVLRHHTQVAVAG